MIFERVKHLIILLTAILFTSGCGNIFEHNSDVQAREALQKLIKAQELFFKENESYARHISVIEDAKKYDIEYHKGVVYMEVETIYDKGYRAIALPAESTTARVFAFDTKQGGFYEMKDAEVSRYVLGALKHIRKEESHKNITDFSSIILSTVLVIFGLKSYLKSREEKQTGIYLSFFTSIFPLAWSLGTLNHLDKDTTLSWLVHFGIFGSLAIAIFCLLSCIRSFKFLFQTPNTASVMGLYISMVITTTFSLGVIGHTLFTYYF
jgi:4-amino-4-deoxy-L-arabinose transferase-like glycosyltransferase